ncbi:MULTISPECIES: hypothetical protein [unclassified Leucobacter]|uniref:hypothetical protein n=1 Tax=unclassified Leucobacter TaxID=2621730 RepID=UPI0006214FF5|nr:hypothetical protein [Leucobacter sp. Ag1]KKI16400.1 hypothetical protein XM48_16560 [Leucobacter sp. Ag1]
MAAKTTGGFRKRKYGRNHAYYLDDRKLDGVTTLLGNGLPKPALVNWAGNATAEYAVDNWEELGELSLSKRLDTLKKSRYAISDEAKHRGTEVHDLAEKLALGQEVEVPDAIAGHVSSALRFLEEFKVETLLTEASVYHETALYAGTFDLLLKSGLPEHAGKVVLADWKTNRTGIYPETALQLTAYAKATRYLDRDKVEHAMADLGITDLWAIWIRSDGYEVYPMEFSDATWKAFGHIVQVARGAANRDVADTWKGAALRPSEVTR